jgi:hypothetical protein
MDGYRSTSLDFGIARTFAAKGESDEKEQVMLRIFMENKEGRYYICLDREDYTIYLDEKEVLLQAGLIAEIKGYEMLSDEHGELTIFNLYVSDKMVSKEKRKRTLDFMIPLIIYGTEKIFMTVINGYF